MRRTIQQQIAANKRMSVVYSLLLVFLLAALGAAIVGYFAPRFWFLGAGGAALLGAIVATVGATSGSNLLLSISQAREATPLELQTVNNVAEEMAIAAGIPMPKVYVIDDDAPNAFATGNSPQEGVVCVTTGLIRKLDRDELQGVVAHEVSHIRNYDIRLMTTLAIVAGLIPMLPILWGAPCGSAVGEAATTGIATQAGFGRSLASFLPFLLPSLPLCWS